MDDKKTTKETSYFRDSLTTVDSKGNRKWIYAKKPKGRLFNRRKIVAIILLALLYITPFIKYKGDPLFLFNILERKFIIFGVIFWPQDFHLILLVFITSLVFVVLFTVIFGRVFCGWVCPQTIFMEFVFRRIEYLIEGDAAAQRRLDQGPWNFNKIWRKSLKHIVFYLMAFITAAVFLSYIISMDQLLQYASEVPQEHLSGLIGLMIFSGIYYFIFAFFREQVCTIACPYGRLQGVLIDKKTIIVAYDYIRGEPRGPLNKVDGDCVDCKQCVAVCPTGIDIRNGTQLECINCTACIDACNATMERVKKPKGLIRYDSEEGVETGHHSVFNARSIAYSVVLTLMIFFVAGLFVMRGEFEATILHARGSLYQEYGNDSISNIYNFNIVNKIRKPIDVEFKLESHAGHIKYLGDRPMVDKGKVTKGSFLVVMDKKQVTKSNTPIIIGLYKYGKKVEEYKSTFVGPNALDK